MQMLTEICSYTQQTHVLKIYTTHKTQKTDTLDSVYTHKNTKERCLQEKD